MATSDGHIPKLSLRPYYTAKNRVNLEDYVGALTDEDGYTPINQIPKEPQSDSAARNAPRIWTVYKGDAMNKVLWATGPLPIVPGQSTKDYKAAAKDYKWQMSTPSPAQPRYGVVQEKVQIYNFRVRLWNLGVDSTEAQAAGDQVEANALRGQIRRLLEKMRNQINDGIAYLTNEEGPTQERETICGFKLPEEHDPDYVEAEVGRLQAMLAEFTQPPSSVVAPDARVDPDTIERRQFPYHLQPKATAIKIWDAKFCREMMHDWLSFAQPAFDVDANLKVTPVRKLLFARFANQCDALYSLVIGRANDAARMKQQLGNVFLRTGISESYGKIQSELRKRYRTEMREFTERYSERKEKVGPPRTDRGDCTRQISLSPDCRRSRGRRSRLSGENRE